MRPETTAPARRTLGVWGLILAAGIILLFARYDWGTSDDQFAKRAFVLSAYLFVILLPTVYYLVRWLLRNETAARVITGVVFVITTLPYHLLGMDGLFYYRDRPHIFTTDQIKPVLQFLPDGKLSTFPFDWLFMPLLFALGAAIIWGVWLIRKRGGLASRRSIPVLLTIAFAFICVQSYAHTSMRAPYTYLGHFVNAPDPPRWYHDYHFDNGTGASIGDQYLFSPLEDYFQGVHHQGDNALIRRPLSFYLASQGSFFINTFYVWLALNCLFWLAAVFATARLITRLATERAGIIAGAFVVVSPAFIAFVGTTAMYLQYYVAFVVALCLFEELVVRPPERRTWNYALFAGVLALSALVYDLLPLTVFLLVYGLVCRVPWKPLVGSLAAAAILARGFTFMVTTVLGIKIDPANDVQITTGVDNTVDLITHPSSTTWYNTTNDVISSYTPLLLHSMFLLPVLVALLGIPLLKGAKRWTFVSGLFLITLISMAFLQIGETTVGHAPRLVYPVFPAVYLLAALALDTTGLTPRLSGPWAQQAIYRARVIAPWVVIGAMFLLVNFDIFGYPTQYMEFFTDKPPTFVP